MQVLPSSRVVLETDDGGSLTVSCRVLQGQRPYDEPYTATVSVTPTDGVAEDGGTYSFAEAGVWSVGCEAEVGTETLTASVDVAVLNEAIDPLVAKVGEGMSGLRTVLLDLMAADGGDDQELFDAMAALDELVPELDPDRVSELEDVLRPIPNGYPDATALVELGIDPVADDDELSPRLEAFAAEVADLQTTFSSLDPESPTADDLQALDEHAAALEAAADDLLALEPSAHGLLAARAELATLLREEIAPTTHAIAQYVDAVVHAEAAELFPTEQACAHGPNERFSRLGGGPDPMKPCFGFLSLTIGLFGRSNLQVQLINQVYGKYIAAVDKMINNLIVIEAIDYYLPPDPEGPVLDLFYASSSLAWAVPGYDTWAEGSNFNWDAQFNEFIIIGDGWQTILDAIWTACGVGEANTIPEKVKAVADCIQDVIDAVENMHVTPLSVEEGYYGSEQHLELGPFPEACSGPLPVPIAIIPINLAVGRGESWLTNCLAP